MSLTNVYHVRRVADTSAKACLICYKPSTSVMITPDNKDFFYVCPAHLQDKHFCSPIIDTEGQAKRLKEEEMAKEIEKVKKEYEEKQRRKKEREKASSKDNKDEKDKGKDEPKDKDKDTSESNANDEKDRDDKIASIQKGSGKETKSDDSPRIFSLHKYVISIIFMKNFYQMRIDRLRNIEMAKRNQERLRQPSLFPSVPSGNP
ncbi:Pc22g18280 [Penicillium rubens Wisconsin 54-1255]|uniref:Pc22g18280 protein n=1 Tax=Penicillium rubens (strain ATCC 28089 / DSM 1075 / NRRL 1951 / Wisconsin 54-1255) TaxID=500485 RepID=B6HU63_PENRW|nr:Pc22g18280 [Penicillium rubens Wisconsin 54-1255]